MDGSWKGKFFCEIKKHKSTLQNLFKCQVEHLKMFFELLTWMEVGKGENLRFLLHLNIRLALWPNLHAWSVSSGGIANSAAIWDYLPISYLPVCHHGKFN